MLRTRTDPTMTFSGGLATLEGRHVRLEPLRFHHLDPLLEAAQDPRIWTWMPQDLRRRAAMAAWLAEAREAEVNGRQRAFAVVDAQSDRVVGSTRFSDLQPQHRMAQIGWTWLAPSVWGTAINTESKLLLLGLAFDQWRVIRVQLITDVLNVRSRKAIKKLGARWEGTLRQHRIRSDGSYRDTLIFSIIDSEWPRVRRGLQLKVGRFSALRELTPLVSM